MRQLSTSTVRRCEKRDCLCKFLFERKTSKDTVCNLCHHAMQGGGPILVLLLDTAPRVLPSVLNYGIETSIGRLGADLSSEHLFSSSLLQKIRFSTVTPGTFDLSLIQCILGSVYYLSSVLHGLFLACFLPRLIASRPFTVDHNLRFAFISAII
ncbi:MAG: hypothetical protein NXY57DRAFT_783246 [Lentinula lateritia]|nr:MAG: hypothetical protein NXY57DRAFT_783246 [Lentinula lateritia]